MLFIVAVSVGRPCFDCIIDMIIIFLISCSIVKWFLLEFFCECVIYGNFVCFICCFLHFQNLFPVAKHD